MSTTTGSRRFLVEIYPGILLAVKLESVRAVPVVDGVVVVVTGRSEVLITGAEVGDGGGSHVDGLDDFVGAVLGRVVSCGSVRVCHAEAEFLY